MLTQDSNFDVQPPLTSSPTSDVQPLIGRFRNVSFSSVVSYVAPASVATPPPLSFSTTDLGSISEVSYAAQVSGSSSSSTTTDLGSISEVSYAAQASATSSELGSTDLSQSACADGTSLCTYRDIRVTPAVMAVDYNDPMFRM